LRGDLFRSKSNFNFVGKKNRNLRSVAPINNPNQFDKNGGSLNDCGVVSLKRLNTGCCKLRQNVNGAGNLSTVAQLGKIGKEFLTVSIYSRQES
jgi:hypothetical protein